LNNNIIIRDFKGEFVCRVSEARIEKVRKTATVESENRKHIVTYDKDGNILEYFNPTFFVIDDPSKFETEV